ncbi:unnamed protein product [Cochlearia groenlandica]
MALSTSLVFVETSSPQFSDLARAESFRLSLESLVKIRLEPPDPPVPPDPPDLIKAQLVQSALVLFLTHSVELDEVADNHPPLVIIDLCLLIHGFDAYVKRDRLVFWFCRRSKLPNLLSAMSQQQPVKPTFVKSFKVHNLDMILSKFGTFSPLNLSFMEKFISNSLCSGHKRSISSSSSMLKRESPAISFSDIFQRVNSFPVSNPRKCSIALISLSSCVAVFTGPEEATEIVTTKSDDIGCLSKSQCKVTIFQQSGLAVDVMWTHPSLDSLSFYHIYPYAFMLVMFKCCCSFLLRILLFLCKLRS